MIKRKLSMPFWCVANPVGDPSGPAVMDRISSLETCDLPCKARAEKKARDLGADPDLAKLMAGLWDKETADIQKAVVDSDRVNGSALQIGGLDQAVTRRILGL